MLRVFVGEGDAWDLLRRAVKQVWDMDELPPIVRLPSGKPVFAQDPVHHFSISHSGNMALCALSDQVVGADIELIRPRHEGLPGYVLRGEDYQRYLRLGGDWSAFYTLWTEKESIVKYTGEGLKAIKRAGLPAGCKITHISGEGWKGAVCSHKCAEEEELI